MIKEHERGAKNHKAARWSLIDYVLCGSNT